MDYLNEFYGREKELKIFEEKAKSKKAELLILYGRRRIGKTQLCLELLKNKKNKGVYFLSTQEKENYNITNFKEKLSKYLNDDIFLSLKNNWEDIFKYLVQRKERLIVVIDEFPYLIKSNPAIVSVFQKIWDLYLSKSNIFLILNGSSISIMENDVLSYQSPLYGRRTAQYNLQKLKFKTLKQFFPKYTFEDLLLVFATLDTIPFYLNIFDNKISYYKNLEKHFFQKDSVLYEEGDFLLKEEFKEITVYKSILKEIARGKTKFNEISQSSSVEKTKLTQYLKNLLTLRLVKKEIPFGEDILRSKRSIYSLNDNFLTFWFNYVLSNKDIIEVEKGYDLAQIIKEDIPRHLGVIFEQVSKEYLIDNFNLSLINKWWFKGEEIDLVGLDKLNNTIYFIECKYKNNITNTDILENLKRKSKLVKTKAKTQQYIIFSKAGFSKKLKDIAKDNKDIILINLTDMNKWIKNSN